MQQCGVLCACENRMPDGRGMHGFDLWCAYKEHVICGSKLFQFVFILSLLCVGCVVMNGHMWKQTNQWTRNKWHCCAWLWLGIESWMGFIWEVSTHHNKSMYHECLVSWTVQCLTVHRESNWREKCEAHFNLCDKQHKSHNTWPVQCVEIWQWHWLWWSGWTDGMLCWIVWTDNRVGDDGMEVLCGVLMGNSTLTKLNMECLLWMVFWEWHKWMRWIHGNGQGMGLVMVVLLHWAMCWRVKKQYLHQSASMVCLPFCQTLSFVDAFAWGMLCDIRGYGNMKRDWGTWYECVVWCFEGQHNADSAGHWWWGAFCGVCVFEWSVSHVVVHNT